VNLAITDHYPCPGNLVNFQLRGKLAEAEGYFRFGRAICYGKSSVGFRSEQMTGVLYDTAPDVDRDGASIRLPFDPDEIINNLRHERYRYKGNGNATGPGDGIMLRNLYYSWLRPILPARIRRYLQRMVLSDWQRIAFPRWPVDGTVERFLERLFILSMEAHGVEKVPLIWFWPEGATSCIIMTHDVDQLAGRDFCAHTMDLDDAAGVKASFQIVPEGRYPISEGFLDEIRVRGFEVNIHDLNHDGLLFSNRQEFLRRAPRINEYGRRYGALGFRSGGLYRNQAWYAALQFSYDMSVPSVAHLDPQRGGCCSVMPFFIGDILELPLTTVQDYALFHVLNDYSIDLWMKQADAIAEMHGLVSFLVHPEQLIETRARKTYQALLENLAEMREKRNVWIALPREVNRWWRERSEMTLVSDGGQWRIEGRGKERARLAFASVTSDGLAFTLDEGRI
jgi:hypothetical protein